MALTQVPSSMLANSGAELGMRNRIINGGMSISQRGTTFTSVGTNPPTYTLDRWFGFRGGYAANLDVSQQTGFSGFQSCLRMQRTSGTSSTAGLNINQNIETNNCYDLAGKTVVVSLVVRAGSNYSGGQLGVQVQTSTTANDTSANVANGTFTAGGFSNTFTISTTASSITLSGAIPSNAQTVNLQIYYLPTGTAGANDYVEITGVQLEVGSNATPFERRLYGQELMLCQRYYWKSAGVNSGFPYIYGSGFTATAYVSANVSFPVQMRTTPTINKYGTWSVSGCGQPSVTGVDQNGFTLYVSATGATNVACGPSGSTTYLDTSGAEL